MNEPEFSVGFFNDGCDTLACEAILNFYKCVSESPAFKLQAAQRGYYDEFPDIVADVIKWGLNKYCRWKNKEYRKEISRWKYNVSWIVKIKLDGH